MPLCARAIAANDRFMKPTSVSAGGKPETHFHSSSSASALVVCSTSGSAAKECPTSLRHSRKSATGFQLMRCASALGSDQARNYLAELLRGEKNTSSATKLRRCIQE